MLALTRKPLVLVTYDLAGMLDGLEMAEIVAGGAGAHGQRPQVAVYINVTRGLLFNEDSVRKLLACAERGVPALWIPVTSGGTTGPITLAGTIAINTAGVLAGVVISQLAREGAPIVVPAFGGDSLDLRTMVDPYAGPEPKGVAASLAHRWGLPMFSLGAGSDSKLADEQAAAEAGMTMLADALAGGHLIHDCGYLESGLTGSLVQLVICDELAGWINALVRPVDVSDEALALDLVDAHGVDGSYLETDHTLAHYRERWYPTLIDRRGYEPWRAAGSDDPGPARGHPGGRAPREPPPDAARPRRGAGRPRRRRPGRGHRRPLTRAHVRRRPTGRRPRPLPRLPRPSSTRAAPRSSPMTDTEFRAMHQAVVDGDADAAEAAARAAIAAGIPPLVAIDEGFMPGMKEVGAGFAAGDLFLPDMMLAARAMQRALAVLEPELKAAAVERTVAGRVVIGTVAGDIHEIGKNLVGMLLSTSGFEVHDLGVNVAPERFVEAAREHRADIVGLSALLTTTMTGQRAVIAALEEAGLRPPLKVMVGGAPVTGAWASEIGADGYSEDAMGAVELAKRLVGAAPEEVAR